MPIQQFGSLSAFIFNSFQNFGIIQGIFTRHGGVSPEPWASLNHGGTVGDERANVIENRKRVFDAMGRNVESIFDVWQVHSADVICTATPRPLDEPHQRADAIVTNRPEITLFMRFADCVPIFFFDPVQRVIGIAHAGWQGTVKKIPLETVRTMVKEYQCRPETILAGIGPSICREHYPVGENVINAAKMAFPEQWDEVLFRENGNVHFDLWKANQLSLSEAGVTQIETAGICTHCHLEDWYSHRGEKGRTGRFGALLALEE